MSCFVCGGKKRRRGFNTCSQFCTDRLQFWQRSARSQMRKQQIKCVGCEKMFTPPRYDSNVCSTKCRHRAQSQLYPQKIHKARAKQYGLSYEQYNQIVSRGCYAPGCHETTGLQIDHDHSCCSGRKSCGKCVRGALCKRHNLYLGHIENDYLFAIWVLRQPHLILKGEWK